MSDVFIYPGDLPCYVLDSLFDNLTDTYSLNVDDRSDGDMLKIITRETKSKFQMKSLVTKRDKRQGDKIELPPTKDRR